MDFEEYIVSSLKNECENVFIFTVKPKNSTKVFDFLPGQFTQIINPNCEKANEPHLFSIASSPTNKDFLEFCVKVYGPWTQALAKIKIGDVLNIKGPLGKFVCSEDDQNCVFIAAGVGIVPIISMLRYISEKKQTGSFILLYRNHADNSIAYKEELGEISKKIKNLKVLHILSSKVKTSANEHQNLITSEFLKANVNLEPEPIFFLCGSPAFIQTTKQALKEMGIEGEKIRYEFF